MAFQEGTQGRPGLLLWHHHDFANRIHTFNKTFDEQISKPSLTELHPLSDSVNAMLRKITQQIAKFELAESEIKELNQSLEEEG